MIEILDINSKIFRKDNLDLVYFITEKKTLNGILHYKFKSENSDEIFLSEFAIRDRYMSETESKNYKQSKLVSRLFTNLIKNGYKIGK
mgnify:FL=1|tara:strand:+ start:399 stop:662 length:264 start_codon:yes stop_codon:yes gene_type:complete